MVVTPVTFVITLHIWIDLYCIVAIAARAHTCIFEVVCYTWTYRSLQQLLHSQARSSSTWKRKYHQIMWTVCTKDIKSLKKNKSYSLVIQGYLMIINDTWKSLFNYSGKNYNISTNSFLFIIRHFECYCTHCQATAFKLIFYKYFYEKLVFT